VHGNRLTTSLAPGRKMHEYQKMSESQIVNYVCEHTDLDRDMKLRIMQG
jgi:hypothetical protein